MKRTVFVRTMLTLMLCLSLSAAWAQERAQERLWDEAGQDLGADGIGGQPWPPLPEQPSEREELYRTRLLELPRDGSGK